MEHDMDKINEPIETGTPASPQPETQPEANASMFNRMRKKMPRWLLVAVLTATGAGAAVGTIMNGEVLGEMPVAVSQALLVSEDDTQQTYNYAGVTSPSTTQVARYDVDDTNLENDPTIGTEFGDPEYAAIAVSDDARTDTTTTNTFNYAQEIYRFKVAAPTYIDEFTVTWEGFVHYVGFGCGEHQKLVIWNYDDDAWEEVSTDFVVYSTYSAPMPYPPLDGVITETLDTDVSDYVNDDGYIYFMVWAKDGPCGNCHSHIDTDYVELRVKCTSQGLVITGADRGHAQANDARTAFIAAAEIDTGDYYTIKVPLKNMANQDIAARITIDAQEPLQVDITGIGELAADGNLTRINSYQWGFVAPPTLGDVCDADLEITVALPDDAPPGYYDISATLEPAEE